ncbi:MAG: hypothetical protein KAJ51_13730, partial [Thermoplasmata archaeon]|nr:hypothetical protein [Thermoplasmata archaeon]
FNISDGKLNDSLVLQFEVIKPNEAPVILDITVYPIVIEPNCLTNITVNGIDNDGDDLDYIYKFTSGEIIGSGSMVTWRAPETGGIYEIETTVFDGVLYSTPKSVNITVFKNYPPVIQNINYPSEAIYINTEINISIIATDKNDDDLNYHYESGQGEIKGNGPNITWHSPLYPGIYSITFWVDDGRLSSETKIIDIIVKEHNRPPVIEEIIVSTNAIKPGETVKIEVKAMDPNEDDIISFFYETDYGYILGEDDIVFWHAPDKIGQYNITIIIKDSFGAMVSENISILVHDQDDSSNNKVNGNSVSKLFDTETIIILLIAISIIIITAISLARKSKRNNFYEEEPIEVEPIEVIEKDN